MAGTAGRSRGTRLAAAAVSAGALLGLIFLGYTLRQPVLQACPACTCRFARAVAPGGVILLSRCCTRAESGVAHIDIDFPRLGKPEVSVTLLRPTQRQSI